MKKVAIDYYENMSRTKDLPPPPVDTDIIYSSFAKTNAAFVLKESDFSEKGDTYYKGGDGTVPSWSSLLTGLKWIYDKKKKNLKQKFKLIEFCSRLSESGKYKFDPNAEQDFIAIGCSCLNKKNKYKDALEPCKHAAMINDENLIEYIFSVVDDPKVENKVTKAKKTAVKKYDSKKDYESICNSELKNIFETAK